MAVWHVFTKELREFFSSRRMVLNVLVMPLVFFPLMMSFSSVAINAQTEYSAFIISSTYPDDPQIRAVADMYGWELIEYSEEEAVGAIESGSIDAYITKGSQGYVIRYSARSQSSIIAASSFAEALHRVGVSMVNSSLSHESDAAFLLNTELDPVSSSEGNATAVISTTFIPMSMVLVCSMAAGIVALALTVREREKKTLEYLLATGARVTSIMAGKFLATFVTTFLASMMTIVSIVLYGVFLPENTVSLSFFAVGWMIVCAASSALFFSSIFICIGSLSRTQREGQLYTGVVSIVSMLPAYFLSSAAPGREPNLYGSIPILNYTCIARDSLYGYVNISIVFSMLVITLCAVSLLFIASVFIMKSRRALG